MDSKDKNYLSLQFWIRIHEKTGTEFQIFFEDLMEKSFTDFQRVRPYGNKGDGGNDGYRPEEGIYYQVYAPKNPNEKEAEAAKKLKEDFEKLMASGWDQISEVKEYRFVFNDKKCGVSMEIERALAELRNDNPTIQFGKLIPKDLEEIFFNLNEKQLLTLGFDIDSTKAVSLAKESLKKLEIDLDRENGKFVEKVLINLKEVIEKLHDENLELDYEILECRTLAKLEKRTEAKKKYESICTRYPKDIRAFLYLAEIAGRSHGGGVLELMPNEVEEIFLPYKEEHAALLVQIDQMMRDKKSIDEILSFTDQVILKKSFGFTSKEIKLANSLWKKLRDRRLNRKK